MAKLIVLEGIERCFKSTIATKLSNNGYGHLLSIKEKQPDEVPFDQLGLYYHGMHVISKEIYKALPSSTTLILDRFYLSELVYSRKFQRKSWINIDSIKEIEKNNEIITIYLNNTYENYLDRNPKNKKSLDRDDYDEMKNYFDFWIKKCSNFGKFYSIDTNKYSSDECYKIITNEIIK